MLAVRCALLAALLAAPGAAAAPGRCSAPEVESDVLTSRPGANVTLTCPGGIPGDNATVRWVLGNQGTVSSHDRWAGLGSRLLLRSVRLSDSGNYSCYRDGLPGGTVRLLVEDPPEEPTLSCFRKSPVSNVVCEWSPRVPPAPSTRAVLLVRKFQHGPAEDSQEPCQYSRESQKFSCQLAVPEGDNSFYIVSLCVANSAGSKSSRPHTFEGYGILRPDPPVNITVTAVDRNPRWLTVTWQDPPSWNSYFYRLQFELRYRAERSKTFTTWMVKELQYHCTIRDAWSGRRHVVQLRAREEFGHGLWSEWSEEVLGTPWTEPTSFSTAPAVGVSSTKAPTTSKGDDISSNYPANTTGFPVQESPVPLYTFLVAGGSLAFGTLLCIGVVLRFHERSPSSDLQGHSVAGVHPPQPGPYLCRQGAGSSRAFPWLAGRAGEREPVLTLPGCCVRDPRLNSSQTLLVGPELDSFSVRF
ncbi:interleukin-6 receptor subunit alpha isoform X1 [Eptesicus fuscus]|uniref:interleukin-6 receptor subunit alpha isoform X1 n=1 Tax=Eptesicus fuscus TaxID=29078 RepID=UPI00240489BF|nr:interleukin-6 receptor subunit alpha isoform X1 [Eptesicus fuscus]